MSAIIIAPGGYPHAQAFAEVRQSFNACLAELGVDPTIVFGAHTLGEHTEDDPRCNIPEHAIIYNTEVARSHWTRPEYLDVLRKHQVWDYSAQNIEWFATQGIKAKHCPIGYHKCLEKIRTRTSLRDDDGTWTDPQQDIDVLFYGSITSRRVPILESILATGLRCKWLFGVYGQERDAYIARSKVVLNLHAYDNSPFEIIRCSYLFANGESVVSEGPEGEWGSLAYFAHTEALPDFCKAAVKHLNADDAQVTRNRFRQRPQIEYLRRLLCN